MLSGMFGAAPGGGGGTGDPYWANVVSLLNMDGADGSTTFTDNKGLIWTASGDAQIDTSLGYNTGLFDGTADYISTPHDSSLVLGAGDFCVEGFVRSPNTTPQQTVIEKRGTGFAAGDWVIFLYNANLEIYSYDVDPAGNPILNASSGIANNTEFHWAWTRSGTTMRLFVGGDLKSTRTSSANIASSAVPLGIGRDNVSGGRFWLNGWVRASRITVGAARYTSNFTPPSAPFPTS